jgi:hypothetical protein
MRSAKVASLTGALLVSKGAASAKQFMRPQDLRYEALEEPAEPAVGVVETLPMAQKPRRERRAKADGQARLSLRMSAVRHLRLRLAAAHLNRSGHSLVTAAVDHYLDNVLPHMIEGRCICVEQGREPGTACGAMSLHEPSPSNAS